MSKKSSTVSLRIPDECGADFKCSEQWMTNILSRVLPKPESEWQVSRLEYAPVFGGFTGPKTTKIKCVLTAPHANPNASQNSTNATSSTARAKSSGPVSEGSDTIPEDEEARQPQRKEVTVSVMSKYCSCPHTDALNKEERFVGLLFPQLSLDNLLRKEWYYYAQLKPLLLRERSFASAQCYHAGLIEDTSGSAFSILFQGRLDEVAMSLILEDLTAPLLATIQQQRSASPELSAQFTRPKFSMEDVPDDAVTYHHFKAGFTIPARTETALANVRALARAHAATWQDEALFAAIPEKYRKPDLYDAIFGSGFMIHLFYSFMFTEENVANLFKTWQSHEDYAWFAEPSIQQPMLIAARNYADRLERFVRRDAALMERYRLLRCKTFLHGDCHNGNIFYIGNQAEYAAGQHALCFVDFQMFGVGYAAVELVYYLASSIEFDAEATPRLLDAYYEELLRSNDAIQDANYSKETFLLEMGLFGISYAMWNTIFHIQSGTPEEMYQKFSETPKFRDNMQNGWAAVVNSVRNSMRSSAYFVDLLIGAKLFAGESTDKLSA